MVRNFVQNKHFNKIIKSPHTAKMLLLLIISIFPLSFQTYGKSNEKIILQLKWKHQFQFAGYYAALEKGFYKELGLDVEIRDLNPKTTSIDEVLSGNANFGVANSELLVRYMNGDPVVALAPIFQNSPSAIVVREKSGIAKPHDILGKSIEIDIKGGANEVLAMLYIDGIKPSQLQVTESTLSLNNLLNNKVDATAIYQTNEPYFLDKFGIPYRLIIPKNYGIDFYAECLFTSQAEIKRNRSRVEKFMAASIKGWEYALKNQDEIAQLIQTKYKSTKTIDHLLYEASQTRNFIQPDVINIGHSNKGRWLRMVEILNQAGIINSTRSIDGFMYKPHTNNILLEHKTLLIFGIALIAIAFLIIIILIRLSSAKMKTIINQQQQKIEQQELNINTLKYEIENLNKKSEDLETFNDSLISNLSFEIRSPLNNILGYCELLNAPRLKTEQTRLYTKEVTKNSHALQHQVDNLIELSKIETNQYKLTYQRINLFDLFNTLHIVTLNELKLFDKDHIAIKICINEDEINFDILSDRNILRNIFWRLISNAVKFTSRGYIELGCKKYGNNNLLFWVQDSGIGIRKEKVQEVFKPFRPNTEGNTFNNLGLGLPIVKGLTEVLGGRVWVDSVEESGTTVNITIPITPVGARSMKASAVPFHIQQDAPNLSDKTILIVEDIQSNYLLLSKMLEETKCKLLHSKTGEEAIEMFNANPDVNLIFMDLRLTDMDGIEITRKIRLSNSKVIIVAQTAYCSGVKVNLSIEAGCNDFITKPISRLDLFNILRKYLSPKDSI